MGDKAITKKVKNVAEPISKDGKVDEAKLKRLNSSAYFILENMHPGMTKEFDIAKNDFGIKDMGIYIMGLLNRLYKTVDYYNPDFEPDWEQRIVDLNDELICQNCKKKITDPKNIKQIYCSNACAHEAKKKSKTGVIQPNPQDLGTEAEQDEKQWVKEQKTISGDL